ncbi:hypothetical protein [Streptomyces spinosisporus]|uniref:SMI1/KNR4 family protein n=2 Tax=Streptomyces TaxID=1883 RepID=A0ABS9XGF1_9ACTN|nr:hypothetical protein [Streptomyces spinosisporus]MCI3241174.1 hypothetical protein [Streptomyces spinosisporus]
MLFTFADPSAEQPGEYSPEDQEWGPRMISRELEELLAASRSLLSEDHELGMMHNAPVGYSGRPVGPDLPADYADFLSKSDGGIFGRVVVFEAKVVVDAQFYADPMEGAPVQLNRDDWFCFGKIDENPVFLHRPTGEVWGFPDTGMTWWQSEAFRKLADDLDSFLLDKAFSSGYPDIFGEDPDDTWLRVLRELNRIP